MLTIPAFAIGILMTFVYLLLILVRGCCGVCKRPREDGYTPKAIAITRGLGTVCGKRFVPLPSSSASSA